VEFKNIPKLIQNIPNMKNIKYQITQNLNDICTSLQTCTKINICRSLDGLSALAISLHNLYVLNIIV